MVMSNITETICLAQDFKEFSPTLDGILLYIFLFLIVLISNLVFLINRGVYFTLEKLDSRPINYLIRPVIIHNMIVAYPYCFDLGLRSFYYPVINLTGDSLCYIRNYYDVIQNMVVQYQTFYITFYRYVCLFHWDFLLSKEITPKVSRITVETQFTKHVS